ncbi:pilus assembly protein TadG-related protein [Cupriavidus nantongensis]|uniref:Pilus assembly protein TadG n=1 Tax=Cupriavidus nantongensis TaxID=1796606 RepID=A0A142JG81_9BURK|nr:TadE/TadG family type IV pilus assembly protein [Cupriavidus nantongensis]AMR77093.1 pilus assembly protein TadG [Cupriavidus nantongensis]
MSASGFARPTLTRRRRQRGAVAIIVGLSLAVLIGFVGLALDLGKLYVTKSELQNSVDACALAAARDVTGATPLLVSEAAGLTTGTSNAALFQGKAVEMFENLNVSYSDTPDNTFYTKDKVPYALDKIKYVKCTAERTGIAHWFIQVLNALPGMNIQPSTVNAMAVATTTSAQTACAIPVYVCTPQTANPVRTAYNRGDWIRSKDEKDPYGPGSFGWADLSPPGGGASELADLLAGSGQCDMPVVGSKVGQPGSISSLIPAWNTRFGLYAGSYKGPEHGAPDFTGYAYSVNSWNPPNGGNAYPDFIQKRAANEPYQTDANAGLVTKGTPSTRQVHQAGADRRLVQVPVVDCNELASSKQATVASWACMLLVQPMQEPSAKDVTYIEYLGDSKDPTSPCATQGVPGSSTGNGPRVPVLVQ